MEPSPWYAAAVRRFRPVIEVLVAVAVAVSTAARDGGSANFAYVDHPGGQPPLWLAAGLGLLVGAAVWQRRRRPELLLIAALAAFVALSAWIVVMLAQFTLAERTASWRKSALATAAVLAAVIVPVWRMGGPDAGAPIGLAIGVVPALIGLYVGTRRELLAGLRERAERAEREQQQRVERARSDERAQIARDMHDVVTHRVSLIVLHATALEATKGDNAVTIGRQIGAIGREALTELRSLVGVLRADEAAPTAPQPGLADLEALVDASRRAGTPVTLEMADATAAAAAGLPALVEHAVYRVVQEALSNVRKHAGRARTRVRISRTPQLLHLAVTNEHGAAGPEHGLPSGGHGLLGIAERVRLLGGILDARPTPEGGFEISAQVPLDPNAVRPEAVR
ncbi:sensor histidine kinase [Streptomyces sp. NPDC058534]|uniref:sensor histidine kinase n=1 Tax=Streptomyces sp. NPDC058534 TaxID=3346541 RepID=UPI003650737B